MSNFFGMLTNNARNQKEVHKQPDACDDERDQGKKTDDRDNQLCDRSCGLAEIEAVATEASQEKPQQISHVC